MKPNVEIAEIELQIKALFAAIKSIGGLEEEIVKSVKELIAGHNHIHDVLEQLIRSNNETVGYAQGLERRLVALEISQGMKG